MTSMNSIAFPHLGECQRWRERRDSYRPAGEPIRKADYDVCPIPNDEARAFVLQHHYSGRYPAGRRRFGLFRGSELVGVAVFSQPMSNEVIMGAFPDLVDFREGVELGRFVLLDEVPANGETWFLARCFDALRREGFAGVVSYSDPCQRTNAAGEVVFGGHLGTIYQAHNAVYLGRIKPRTIRLLPDGTVFSDRAASKIRNKERGWAYAVDQLVAAGAEPPEGDLRSWFYRVRDRVTRAVRHNGNHKYAWGLIKSAQCSLPTSAAYPKYRDVQPVNTYMLEKNT